MFDGTAESDSEQIGVACYTSGATIINWLNPFGGAGQVYCVVRCLSLESGSCITYSGRNSHFRKTER